MNLLILTTGWYCRKNYPAFNVQGVVDSQKKFISYAIRPGSQNDKSVYNGSIFGQTCASLIPEDFYFVADAGYTLHTHLITPYKQKEGQPVQEVHFNKIHSQTRMKVENAFGILKNRFRILKAPLAQKSFDDMALIIKACIVLHNLLILFNDEGNEYLEAIADQGNLGDLSNGVEGQAARDRRDRLKEYMYSIL